MLIVRDYRGLKRAEVSDSSGDPNDFGTGRANTSYTCKY